MYTTPLSDAIKRAVGARMPQPSSDPFIALTVDVPELLTFETNAPFTVYLPIREVFK